MKISLEIPQKEQKLGGKISEKTSFQVGMELGKVQKQGRDEKASRTYPTTKQASSLYGLQHNACASIVCFVVYVTK